MMNPNKDSFASLTPVKAMPYKDEEEFIFEPAVDQTATKQQAQQIADDEEWGSEMMLTEMTAQNVQCE